MLFFYVIPAPEWIGSRKMRKMGSLWTVYWKPEFRIDFLPDIWLPTERSLLQSENYFSLINCTAFKALLCWLVNQQFKAPGKNRKINGCLPTNQHRSFHFLVLVACLSVILTVLPFYQLAALRAHAGTRGGRAEVGTFSERWQLEAKKYWIMGNWGH